MGIVYIITTNTLRPPRRFINERLTSQLNDKLKAHRTDSKRNKHAPFHSICIAILGVFLSFKQTCAWNDVYSDSQPWASGAMGVGRLPLNFEHILISIVIVLYKCQQ